MPDLKTQEKFPVAEDQNKIRDPKRKAARSNRDSDAGISSAISKIAY